AKLISIFIESTLYGVYILSFVLTCWVLVKKRQSAHSINKSMIIISTLMFLIATLHISVSYVRIIKAFIILRNEPGGTYAFFIRLSEFTYVFEMSIFMTQILLGDGLVLWRAYKIWGDRLSVIIFPLLLMFGSAIVDIRILIFFAKTSFVPTANPPLYEWFYFFPTTTLATNLLCTGLVAYRIWYFNRRTGTLVGNSLRPVFLLVIESGAIYSATLIILLIAYGTGSLITNLILDALSSIIGLVFSMVIIRIGLGLTASNGESE
ncbi:hypothetical protein BJ912DRAFT_1106823, partial [Pholiota molesta]